MFVRRYLLTAAAATYFGILIGLTFMPGAAAARTGSFWPFVLFVPVGVLLLLLVGRRRWWVAVGFGLLGAAWIEAAQVIWMPDGYASVSDVIWASIGVVVGVALSLGIDSTHRKSIRSHESHSVIAQANGREVP